MRGRYSASGRRGLESLTSLRPGSRRIAIYPSERWRADIETDPRPLNRRRAARFIVAWEVAKALIEVGRKSSWCWRRKMKSRSKDAVNQCWGGDDGDVDVFVVASVVSKRA